MEKVFEFLAEDKKTFEASNSFERTLIFCKHDKSAMAALLTLYDSKTIFGTFSEYLITNDKTVLERERVQVNNGEKMLAICNMDFMDDFQLGLAKHYIFLDFPLKIIGIKKMLDRLNTMAQQSEQVIDIDFLTTNMDARIYQEALNMEMTMRGSQVPKWLTELVNGSSELPEDPDVIFVRTCKPDLEPLTAKPAKLPSPRQPESKPSNEASSSQLEPTSASQPPSRVDQILKSRSGLPTKDADSSSEVAPRKRKPKSPAFDIYNMKRQPDGTFLIPSHVMGFCNEDLSEDDEEPDPEYDSEEEYNWMYKLDVW